MNRHLLQVAGSGHQVGKQAARYVVAELAAAQIERFTDNGRYLRKLVLPAWHLHGVAKAVAAARRQGQQALVAAINQAEIGR